MSLFKSENEVALSERGVRPNTRQPIEVFPSAPLDASDDGYAAASELDTRIRRELIRGRKRGRGMVVVYTSGGRVSEWAVRYVPAAEAGPTTRSLLRCYNMKTEMVLCFADAQRELATTHRMWIPWRVKNQVLQ